MTVVVQKVTLDSFSDSTSVFSVNIVPHLFIHLLPTFVTQSWQFAMPLHNTKNYQNEIHWNTRETSTFSTIKCLFCIHTLQAAGASNKKQHPWLIGWFAFGFRASQPWSNRFFVPHIESWEPRNLTYWSSRWPPSLNSEYPPAPRERRPDMHVWVRPKPRTHKECGARFPLSPRTSCTRDCQAALVGRDVSSGC